MGIRYEKDTILNWINEMGKFLRLLVERWDDKVKDNSVVAEIEAGYQSFFEDDRVHFVQMSTEEIIDYVKTLPFEKIRPLAQLMMYDGLINQEQNMLQKAKTLFEWHMQQSGSFAFEDYGFLAKIEQALRD